jgi:hypothetical protein
MQTSLNNQTCCLWAAVIFLGLFLKTEAEYFGSRCLSGTFWTETPELDVGSDFLFWNWQKKIYLWRQKRTVNFRVRLGWGLIVCSFFAEQLITYSFSIGSRAKKLIKLQDFINPNF